MEVCNIVSMIKEEYPLIEDEIFRFPGDNNEKQSFVVGEDQIMELDLKYDEPQLLGMGSYGLVCSCLNREIGERVAIKKIENAMFDEFTALSTLREIQILRQIHHENVIALKDVMISSSPAGVSDFQHVYLVEELMDFDLAYAIANMKLMEQDSKRVLFQILRGVDYIHSVNVIHRDIKPQNLLLNKELKLKICDFGHACTMYDKSTDIGTYVYKAPELLIGNGYVYGNEVDMWSIGCTFAEMLGGVEIFKVNDIESHVNEIHRILGSQATQVDVWFLKGSEWKDYVEGLLYSPGVCLSSLYPEADPLAIDLLERMLVFDPFKRITASEALKHPYFSEIDDDPLMPCTSFDNVRLEVDENPEIVSEEYLRELLWNEVQFFHPEQRKFRWF